MTQADRPIDDVVAELEALEAKATAGPWELREHEGLSAIAHPSGFVLEDDADGDMNDRRLMAAMRNALPRLLAERRELRRLPVIATCVQCAWLDSGMTGCYCMHHALGRNGAKQVPANPMPGPVGCGTPPPAWCPLRKDPTDGR